MKFKSRPQIVEAFRWKVDQTPSWFNYEVTKIGTDWVISKPGTQDIIAVNEGDYLVQGPTISRYSAELFDKFYFPVDSPKIVFYHIDYLENGQNKKTVIEGSEGEEEELKKKFPQAWSIRATDSMFDY